MKPGKKYRHSTFCYSSCIWLLGLVLFTACQNKKVKHETEPAFYFWKSVFNISPYEQQRLGSLKIKTLYVKYFDVDWDEVLGRPVPKASLRTSGVFNDSIEIIPCVFITNECIHKLDSNQVQEMSKNIIKLIVDINNSLEVKNREMQFDCDWTSKSSRVYFQLLNALKKDKAADSTTASAKISATIRLYQVKYLDKTGVPPVDRGLLMAYNMGNLRDPQSGNSILETSELEKYVSYLSSYPLELDVALPIFEWAVLFRENKFSGLISELPEEILSSAVSKKVSKTRYELNSDTTIGGYSFKKNDQLRIERSDASEILSTAKIIRDKLRNRIVRLALFHLDSLTLSKYSLHELETFFSSLN